MNLLILNTMYKLPKKLTWKPIHQKKRNIIRGNILKCGPFEIKIWKRNFNEFWLSNHKPCFIFLLVLGTTSKDFVQMFLGKNEPMSNYNFPWNRLLSYLLYLFMLQGSFYYFPDYSKYTHQLKLYISHLCNSSSFRIKVRWI